MDIFPAELMQEILQYFKPNTTSPIIAEDATWRVAIGAGFSNWWSGKEGDSRDNEISIRHYRDILTLRL
jgi:hypothetical protein